MKNGKEFRSGDVILTKIQFTDTFEIKIRPALILFEEMDNLIVAGITSNKSMKGIPITKKEGAIKDSVIKLNYLFTISKVMVSKFLFDISPEKRNLVFKELVKRLDQLTK